VVAVAEEGADGVELAVATNGAQAVPAFVPAAGEHPVFDAGECDPRRDCHRSVNVVLRLADGAAATDVNLTVASRVFYPDASLPAGAALTFTGFDEPPRPVAVHNVDAEVNGAAQVDPARPLDITIRYSPARTTLLRLHGGQLTATYDPGAAAAGASGSAGSVLGIGLQRGSDVETLELPALQDLAQPIMPLATCLARCELTYRLMLTPTPVPTDPAAKLTWQASAWVFVVTGPDAAAPQLELEAAQAPGG
jgi:hypothetical protein